MLVARRRAGCASAGSRSPRSRCASAPSRGRRPTRDVCEAIDFLEYYARGAVELDGRRASCSRSPASATRCSYRRARRRRGDRAVELPGRDPVRDGRRGARHRQRRRAQAGRAGAGLRARARPGAARGGRARRTRSRCCPARARSAPRSCATRACTRSPSPARPPVGQEIVRTAAETPPGQGHLKRVIAEMGGKNCVIVDADADLDEVVPALVKSAFVYAGQKCSAAARVLVPRGDPRRARRAARRRRRRARGRAGGAARHRRPAGDRARGAGARRALRGRGRARPGGSRPPPSRCPARGWFATPARGHRPAATTRPCSHEEIFGPLLAVERVRDVEDACDRVDASPFGLTGGLFARNPDTVDHVSTARRSATST